MDVERILKIGYLDAIKLDGTLEPVYESNGTIILPDTTFKESLDKSDEAFKHGIAHLRINLIGESSTDINSVDLDKMRQDREESGLVKLESNSSIDRYILAYIDILILKSDYTIPFRLEANGKKESDFEKLAKSTDKLELMLTALDVGKYIADKYDYSGDWINIAIVDKVYVQPAFRRCKISTWLHLNLADIINMYGLVFPNAVLLSYGDFSNEAEELFKMSREQYNKMLIRHYKSVGYNRIQRILIKSLLDNKNILYKLFV